MVVVDPRAAADRDRTCHLPEEAHLVVEVTSPESADRDRDLKPREYAAAGIRHLWRVEESDGRPVVHVYELDPATPPAPAPASATVGRRWPCRPRSRSTSASCRTDRRSL